MVNYCCVPSCKRNSKINKQLKYYSLPKNRERQELWLKAARRLDLIKKDPQKLSLSYRFCSRHFQGNFIKNKNLSPDAIPTLHLPGANEDQSLHRFPSPEHPIFEKFIKWKSVLPQSFKDKSDEYLYKRVFLCNNHFDSCYKRRDRKLLGSAVPTLNLTLNTTASSNENETCRSSLNTEPLTSDPVSNEKEPESGPQPVIHEDVICDNCKELITGFRYKCVNCPNYDLCIKCETRELHPEHFMLRISNPVKLVIADSLIEKWRRFFKSEHVTVPQSNFKGNLSDSDTSDDEFISKYKKEPDIHIPNEIKDQIQKEVFRVVHENKVEKVLHGKVINIKLIDDAIVNDDHNVRDSNEPRLLTDEDFKRSNFRKDFIKTYKGKIYAKHKKSNNMNIDEDHNYFAQPKRTKIGSETKCVLVNYIEKKENKSMKEKECYDQMVATREEDIPNSPLIEALSEDESDQDVYKIVSARELGLE